MTKTTKRRDAFGVDLYFDEKTRRGIALCNEQYKEKGEEELSLRVFAKTAITEKIKRDLDVESRAAVQKEMGKKKDKYPLLTEQEIEGLPEI